MKKVKRVLALLLAVCMLSAWMPTAYAAPLVAEFIFTQSTSNLRSIVPFGDSIAFRMDATYVSTEQDGRYVDVTLSVENNDGFASFDVNIPYDSTTLHLSASQKATIPARLHR